MYKGEYVVVSVNSIDLVGLFTVFVAGNVTGGIFDVIPVRVIVDESR